MKKMIFCILILVLFISCGDSSLSYSIDNSERANLYIPPNAKITKDHGNGWIEFTLEDHTYLFFLVKSGYRGYSALTLIE
jgi:hypothetical protein